ncbi:hypothetical protein [Azonexus sp.]|uniref:hypothetical protein n=1 Tax=Azonexus sp. TaxID=1872668 RepID=UPI0027BAA2A3|nr:hypothetical protein [Azonexus sp.]
MLFQPAIIALLLAAGLAVLMLLLATPFALQVIRRWDIGSGSEYQLILERRTYLFSTLVSFVLVVQLGALLLFVFNADRLSAMFVGAMCAVGTLNVNEWGFPALIAQMLVFFLAAAWLAINHVDTQARDYPLVRIKYGLLIVLLPFLAASFWLQFRYFSGLKANVITSCCGSMFSTEAESIAGDLSALPPLPAIWLFYSTMAVTTLLALWHWRRRGVISGGLLAVLSAAGFIVAMTGVLSFVSLYIYEHPHHHCPFCILKPEYDYRGYALYLPLFAATAAGLGAGAIQPFARVASLREVIPRVSARLAALTAAGFLLFTAIATWFVLASNLILIEH